MFKWDIRFNAFLTSGYIMFYKIFDGWSAIMISVNNTVLQGRTLASWNMAVADPDLQISGGRRSPKKFFSTLRASFWSKKKIRPPPLDPPLHGVPFDPKPVKERMWLAMIVLHKCFRYFVSTKQMMLALKKLFNSLCETKWSSGRFVNCAIFFLVLRSSTVESVTRRSLKY